MSPNWSEVQFFDCCCQLSLSFELLEVKANQVMCSALEPAACTMIRIVRFGTFGEHHEVMIGFIHFHRAPFAQLFPRLSSLCTISTRNFRDLSTWEPQVESLHFAATRQIGRLSFWSTNCRLHFPMFSNVFVGEIVNLSIDSSFPLRLGRRTLALGPDTNKEITSSRLTFHRSSMVPLWCSSTRLLMSLRTQPIGCKVTVCKTL